MPNEEKALRQRARNMFESIALNVPIEEIAPPTPTPAPSPAPSSPVPAGPKPGPNDNPFPDMPLPMLREQPLN